MTHLSKSPRTSALLWTTAALLLGATGCEQDVVVGEDENPGEDMATVPEPALELEPLSAGTECGLAGPAEDFNNWLSTQNDVGDFAGSAWEGYVDLGPDLRLEVGLNGNATLFVGEPISDEHLQANGGYLCRTDGPNDCPKENKFVVEGGVQLLDGSVLPLRGIQASGPRLQIDVQTSVAFAPFCALQTPVPGEDECQYAPSPPDFVGEPVQCGPETDLNCGFVAASAQCRCNEDECFPDVYTDMKIDLTLGSDDKLVGSSAAVWGGEPQRVQLWRVLE